MSRSPRRRLLTLAPFAAMSAAGAVALFTLLGAGTGTAVNDGDSAGDLGAQLYGDNCASCHGVDGRGVEGLGPSLAPEGRAALDFVLRTGRMPIADPGMQTRRRPVRFSEAEIRALVDYAATFGSGPDTPDVDIARGDLVTGGEIYRLNCAACHVASGSGAAIGGGQEAPSLMSATPTQVGQAIVVGPGAMPVFTSFDAQDINDVARYIADLQRRHTAGVDAFGGAGPVAEGLAAWLLGLLPLIALTRWIGRPHEGRDRRAVEGVDGTDVDAPPGARVHGGER
jgi:ubiquinol-cytochrome c reductase cytochrome c subunit